VRLRLRSDSIADAAGTGNDRTGRSCSTAIACRKTGERCPLDAQSNIGSANFPTLPDATEAAGAKAAPYLTATEATPCWAPARGRRCRHDIAERITVDGAHIQAESKPLDAKSNGNSKIRSAFESSIVNSGRRQDGLTALVNPEGCAQRRTSANTFNSRCHSGTNNCAAIRIAVDTGTDQPRLRRSARVGEGVLGGRNLRFFCQW